MHAHVIKILYDYDMLHFNYQMIYIVMSSVQASIATDMAN